MPPCPLITARYVRARWSTYLSALAERAGVSRSSIARTLDVPVSRVSQWMNGDRLVVAGAAFDHGETLRDRLGLETSGIEALYACGYLAEVLLVLKHLSVNLAAEGDLIAVDLYSWLPTTVFALEPALLEAQLDASEQRDENVVRSNLREFFRLGTELDLYDFHADEHAAERASVASAVRSKGARATILAAWQDVQTGRLRPTRALPITKIVRRRGTTQAEKVLAHLKGEPLPTAPDILAEVTQVRKHEINRDGNVAFIDAVIDIAERSRSVFPSLNAPRLWRMLAEWVFYVDEQRFLERRALMPHSFWTYEDRPFTEDEARHLDRLQYMREQARG